MTQVEREIAAGVPVINVPFETVSPFRRKLYFRLTQLTVVSFQLNLPETVQITNGGTGPINGSILLATRGRGNLPAALVLLNPNAPNNATTLLDNFFGRQFDSMNDLKIHPSGNIFFTDDKYVLGFHDQLLIQILLLRT